MNVVRRISLILCISIAITSLTACKRSQSEKTDPSVSVSAQEKTEFSLNTDGPVSYFGSVVIDTLTSENANKQTVYGGLVTDTAIWILVGNEQGFFMEEFSLQGDRKDRFKLDCEAGAIPYCMMFEYESSILIAFSDYNELKVLSFDPDTHSTATVIDPKMDDDMRFGEVIALRDNVLYVSMWSTSGVTSCRGYDLSDGSLKMKLDDNALTECFFWNGEQMYTLGQQLSPTEYELLFVDSEMKLKQAGTIELPEYPKCLRNIDGKQYLENESGIWMLEESTGSWRRFADWNHAEVSQVGKQEYTISKEGSSIFVWDRNESKSAFLFPEDDPTEGKIVLKVAGNMITYNEKYQWIMETFNKKSEKYAVELVDYESILDPNGFLDPEGYVDYSAYSDALDDQLWKVLMNGDGPDIFIRDQFYSDSSGRIDTRFFEYGGLFMDLKPACESMGPAWKDQYLTNLTDVMENDGALYTIPLFYRLRALEKEKDCNLDQMATYVSWAEYMDQHADGRALKWTTGSDYLRSTLCYDLSSFIDEEKHEARFDTPEFRALLHLAKEHCLSSQEIENASERQCVFGSWTLCAEYTGEIISGSYESRSSREPYGYLSASGAGMCFWPTESVSVSTSCKDEEGAWEFICFLLSADCQEYDMRNPNYSLGDYPVRWDSLEELFEFLENPLDHEDFWKRKAEGADNWSIDQQPALTEEEKNAFLETIRSAHMVFYPDIEIIDIVMEETAPWFSDQKSMDEVIDLINKRVQLVLDERRT